ncbi:hypothetical protein [Salinadaptatus halalkaliphilus]|nr:hypothetical protein [Salinadaptatus halalkaliphilus]
MECDTCATEGEIAYTLTTYVERNPSEQIDLHFCSSDCLDVWT